MPLGLLCVKFQVPGQIFQQSTHCYMVLIHYASGTLTPLFQVFFLASILLLATVAL